MSSTVFGHFVHFGVALIVLFEGARRHGSWIGEGRGGDGSEEGVILAKVCHTLLITYLRYTKAYYSYVISDASR